jgi:hypothetical protein
MTGFKKGAAEGPFDGDEDEGDAVDVGAGVESGIADRRATAGADADAEERGESTAPSSTSSERDSLPWLYSRSSITDGRVKTVQLHLQQSTLDSEREAKTDIEGDLDGETVNKADLREAAYLVGLRHSDEVASILRDCGYGAE